MKYTFSEMARVTRGRVDLTPTKDEQQAAHEWLCKVDPDYAGRVQLTSDESQEVVDAAIEARLKDGWNPLCGLPALPNPDFEQKAHGIAKKSAQYDGKTARLCAIPLIKAIRELTGAGLKESKDYFDKYMKHKFSGSF